MLKSAGVAFPSMEVRIISRQCLQIKLQKLVNQFVTRVWQLPLEKCHMQSCVLHKSRVPVAQPMHICTVHIRSFDSAKCAQVEAGPVTAIPHSTTPLYFLCLWMAALKGVTVAD